MFLRWLFLVLFAGLSQPSPLRSPAVSRVLARHDACLRSAVRLVRSAVDPKLLGIAAPVYQQRIPVARFVESEHTLVDASLDMLGALQGAVGLGFHRAREPVGEVLALVVQKVASAPFSVTVGLRKRLLAVVREASFGVRPLTRDLRALVPEFALPIAGGVDFGLVEVLVVSFDWVHKALVDCLIEGFWPVGDVPVTRVHRPVVQPATEFFSRESNAKAFDDAVRILEKRAQGASAQALEDMEFVWRGALEECDKGFCEGPLSRSEVERMFRHTEFGPRPIPSFCIWQKGKPRRIDDALCSKHNALTGMWETIVCEKADLPARICAEFAKYIPLEALRMRLGTDDIASAYRVLVSAAPQYTIAAVWRPAAAGVKGAVKYFVLRGFNFGLKSAPVHLATLMKPLVDFARKLLLVPCGEFYDDVVVVDPCECGASAQTSLCSFFKLIGFPFADKKHEKMRTSNPFLGVVTNFAHLASGWVLLQVKESRRRKLLDELKAVRDSGKLTSAQAARLRGKLFFLTTTAFFGVGRPALQAFTARQYSSEKGAEIGPHLRQAINFFILLLQRLPPVKFPLIDSSREPLYIWTDAAWEPLKHGSGELVTALDDQGQLFYLGQADVAFVVFDPESGVWHEGHSEVGFDVMRFMVPGKKTYIGQLEALAAACVLESLPPSLLSGREAMWWIDNLAAKYGLQKGYSKVDDSGRIINAFKVKQAELGLAIWFEYVPSAQNLADLPSRGRFGEMREVVSRLAELVGASGWTWADPSADGQGYRVCFPEFSTWEAPLESAAGPKRRRKSGSRGAKRPRSGD